MALDWQDGISQINKAVEKISEEKECDKKAKNNQLKQK